MNRSLLTRGAIILAVAVLAAWSALPPKDKLKLGLDLRGGMHMVLEVQTDDAVRAETDQEMDRMRSILEDQSITGGSLQRSAASEEEGSDEEGEAAPQGAGAGQTRAALASFDLTGIGSDQRDAVRKVYRDYFSNTWSMDLVGDRFHFEMNDAAQQEIRRQTVDQAIRNIDNRINAYGVAEPVIQRQGFSDSERIVLQLPGVDDPERVKELIKRTAFLEFRLTDKPWSGNPGYTSREAILEEYGGQLPPDIEIMSGNQYDLDGNVSGQLYWAVEKRSVVTGRDLKNARVTSNEFNQPAVGFTLSAEKGRLFGEVTEQNRDRGLAVVIDGQVLKAPTIRAKITTEGIIEGGFSTEEAVDLTTALKSGALPAGITYLEERTVGPSLGQDSIDAGLRAGLIGAGLVVLTMLVVYMLSGVNAVFVLTLNVLLVFGALAGFGATLTLPGIAGIILTIGMAVDANVLIFERIREELRAGRAVKSAVSAGFEKALSSILDANITTLIAALFLFNFGTGPIRGFAVTLSIGIFASVFTAVFVSRWIFDLWLSRRRQVERLSI